MKAFAERVFADEAYRNSLWARLLDGRASHMERYLAEIAGGTPIARVEVSSGETGFKVIFTDQQA